MSERLHKNDPLPTMNAIKKFIGSEALEVFNSLISYLDENYSYKKEITYGGKKYGVVIRYRRSGKTLLGIFPEKGSISVVIVFGKGENLKFNMIRNEFSEYICSIFDATKQYHDGRWLLIRLEDTTYLKEIIKLVSIKKAPLLKTKTRRYLC